MNYKGAMMAERVKAFAAKSEPWTYMMGRIVVL